VRLLLAGILLSSFAPGQRLLDGDKAAEAARFFEPGRNDRPLQCDVRPVQPHLSYGFRLQTGYAVHIPLKQFIGPGRKIAIVSRVVPDGGDPKYLVGGMRLPNIPKTKDDLDIGGMFLVGEGRYRVDWMLADDHDRVCRKSWSIQGKLDPNERSLNLGLAPGTVNEISLRRWSSRGSRTDDVRPIRRLTVLLHAAPIMPRRTRLTAADRALLLGSLVSLLETIPAGSIRLVVFNLDQQKELFRQDVLAPEAFDEVADSLGKLQLQIVDYHVLQNRLGHLSLLTGLVNQELQEKDASEAVIFLGPATRYSDKVPDIPIDEHSRAVPRVFYLQFKGYWDRGADFPDSIDFAMKKVKGKTIRFHTPDEFAKAIKQIEVQLSGAKRPGAPGS